MTTAAEWSEPFRGITHLGSPDDYRWATVEDCGGYAQLLKWARGEGFRCSHARLATVEAAKQAGEAWVSRGV